MTMPRWRTSTWAFLIFNVVMMGLVFAVLGSVESRTTFGGVMVVFSLGMSLVVIWLIGLLVIGVTWLRGRPRDGAHGPATPSDVWSVTGSGADALLAQAAATVGVRKALGKSLVEAAWMSKQQSRADDPLLLNVAFGDSGVQYWALWPDGEDAMEAVLARVPGVGEQDRPR